MEQCGRKKTRTMCTKDNGHAPSWLRMGMRVLCYIIKEQQSTSPGGYATLLAWAVMMMVAIGPPPVLVNSRRMIFHATIH